MLPVVFAAVSVKTAQGVEHPRKAFKKPWLAEHNKQSIQHWEQPAFWSGVLVVMLGVMLGVLTSERCFPGWKPGVAGE